MYGIGGRDERVINETAYAIEMSAGQPAHAGFVRQVRRFAQQVKPFLVHNGVIEGLEHAALCGQIETELTNQDFCGLSFLLVCGHRVRDSFHRFFQQATITIMNLDQLGGKQ